MLKKKIELSVESKWILLAFAAVATAGLLFLAAIPFRDDDVIGTVFTIAIVLLISAPLVAVLWQFFTQKDDAHENKN